MKMTIDGGVNEILNVEVNNIYEVLQKLSRYVNGSTW